MSFKKCLFCGESISESAKQCPKCCMYDPLNPESKKEYEQRIFKEQKESTKKEIEKKILGKNHACRDCGYKLTTKSILENKTCPQCGCTTNTIKCSICNANATCWDSNLSDFACSRHIPKFCWHCKKRIRNFKITEKREIRGSSGYSNVWYEHYHITCRLRRNLYNSFTFENFGCLVTLAVIVWFIWAIFNH